MRAWQSAMLVAFVWGVIYLPGLGDLEYKGEEPRRVQPAIHMVETGNWLVPHIGGEVYYKKPPLINWAIAGTFLATGGRSEFAARLPSTLGILAMALVLAVGVRSWLGPVGACCAAVFFLTHIANVDKGRLAEIEALYIFFFGAALVLWIAAFLRKQRNLALWTLPLVLLAAGVLTKGPPHLAFFYAMIGAILWRAGDVRSLWSWGHLVSVLIAVAVVCAWVLPFFASTSGGKAVNTYYTQMAMRVAGETDQFSSGDWLLNIPKALANFLPWTLLWPSLWWPRLVSRFEGRERAVFLGSRDVSALLYVGIGLLPGVAPRYLMPLLVVPCALLGWSLALHFDLFARTTARIWRIVLLVLCVLLLGGLFGGAVLVPNASVPQLVAGTVLVVGAAFLAMSLRSRETLNAVRLCFASGLLAGAAVFGYAACAAPIVNPHDDVRPIGQQINALASPEDVLVAVDPESRPFLAYVRPGLRYARCFSELPAETTLVIFKAKDAKDAHRAGVQGKEILRFKDRGSEDFVLMRVSRKRT